MSREARRVVWLLKLIGWSPAWAIIAVLPGQQAFWQVIVISTPFGLLGIALSELLMPGEVARIFRVDPKTVTSWAAAGKLPSIRTPGGQCRFKRSDIMAALDGDG